jgi:AAA+ ATPase superfamily predicted ATPase
MIAGMDRFPPSASPLIDRQQEQEDLRRLLITDLAQWAHEDLRPEDYPTWRTVFNLLLDLRSPEPLAVVLDEFQYLAESETGLAEVASELNAAWERRRAPRSLLLVLSGSAVGTMEGLASGGSPLYGRFSWQRRLHPFDYWYAGELAPFPDLRERALAYGIFGGTPRYLAAVDPSRGLAANVSDLLLSPSGEVRLLVETALDQEEGLRDVSKYRAILRAVAGGCTERNEIAQRAGLANDAGLRDKLGRLIELGYLETRQNIDAKPNEAVRYGIADPAFRFHQRFVEPNTSVLERFPAPQIWESHVAPHLDGYMGREFERMVAQAYDRLCVDLGLPVVQEWGRWEGVDRDRRSLEIDLIGILVDGGVERSSHGVLEPGPVLCQVTDPVTDHLAVLPPLRPAGRLCAGRGRQSSGTHGHGACWYISTLTGSL